MLSRAGVVPGPMAVCSQVFSPQPFVVGMNFHEFIVLVSQQLSHCREGHCSLGPKQIEILLYCVPARVRMRAQSAKKTEDALQSE